MSKDLSNIIEQFVDFLMPELTPHEASLYIFLFRNSYIKNGKLNIRIGQRTIAVKYGQGPKKSMPSRQHIVRQLKMLEKKGAISIGDTNREGILYTIVLPEDIPLVLEKMSKTVKLEENYFTDPDRRREIFIRDKYICHYCGEEVTEKNTTLYHLIPQSKGGEHTKDNLKTCCLVCNAIKSGKTYEEAAPFLLKSIRERKSKKYK